MFKFYFQSGEFYADSSGVILSLIKDFLLPFLGVGIPLWIYIRGVKAEKVKEAEKRNKFESDKLRYLTHLIIGVEDYLNKILIELEGVVETINKDSLNIGDLQLIPSNDLVRVVDKINQEEFYHSYVGHFENGSENIRITFYSLDTINNVREKVEVIWEQANSDSRKKDIEIKMAVNHILTELRRLEGDLTLGIPEYVLDKFNVIIEKYKIHLRSVRYSHEHVDNMLLTPIALFIESLYDKSFKQKLSTMYDIAFETMLLITQSRGDNNYLKKELAYQVGILKDVKIIFEVNIIALKSSFA